MKTLAELRYQHPWPGFAAYHRFLAKFLIGWTIYILWYDERLVKEKDPMPRSFRFGVVAAYALSRTAWVTTARRAEELGYSTLLIPDRTTGGILAPIPALAVAASRKRVSAAHRIGLVRSARIGPEPKESPSSDGSEKRLDTPLSYPARAFVARGSEDVCRILFRKGKHT